jgi:Dodecin
VVDAARWVRAADDVNIAARPSAGARQTLSEDAMAKKQADAVYRIVDVVGVSETSWEDAGRNAVKTAAGSSRK